MSELRINDKTYNEIIELWQKNSEKKEQCEFSKWDHYHTMYISNYQYETNRTRWTFPVSTSIYLYIPVFNYINSVAIPCDTIVV